MTSISYGTGEYTYKLVDGWAKCPEGRVFNDVAGLCVDSQDRVYILNRSARPVPVMVFDREGNLLSSWGEGFFRHPHGICIGPDGSVYCTDDELHVVLKFSPRGELLMTLGKKGHPSDSGYVPEWFDYFWSLSTISRGAPPFNRPTGVSLSPSGGIYISDGYGNARIHKFSPRGKLLLSWGEPGSDPGQFRVPHGIWVDKQENVWVADRENNRIQIFDAQGKFLNQWGNLIRPNSIWIDDDGTVYVSELCLRISIFTNDGKLLTRLVNQSGDKESALFVVPHTIAVDSQGDIYVGEVAMTYAKVDRGSRTVIKFARRTHAI